MLGQQFEISIGQMILFKGEDSWFSYVLSSPIALVLLCIVLLLIVVPQVQAWRGRQAARAAAEGN